MRQRLRLPVRRLRLRRLRRLRLLFVVGSLPYLLDLARSDYVDRRKVMAGLTRFDPANYVLARRRMTAEWMVNPSEKRRRTSETTALSQAREYVSCNGDPDWSR